ncbi:MAG: TetR/AcrR family transcriptional regulator [Solirubrobacterales bacterium]
MNRPAAQPPGKLPRGRHAASREVVADSQRRRLIAGMTAVVSAKGYAATTVLDVVREAGVAKPAFYEQFSDKQACLIAAYDAGIESIMRGAVAALSDSGRPAERIEHGVAALLDHIAANESEARVVLVEIVGGGPEAVVHMKATHRALAEQYVALREVVRRTYPDYPSLTRVQGLAVVGAVLEPVTEVLITEGVGAVAGLKDELVPVVLALSMAGGG